MIKLSKTALFSQLLLGNAPLSGLTYHRRLWAAFRNLARTDMLRAVLRLRRCFPVYIVFFIQFLSGRIDPAGPFLHVYFSQKRAVLPVNPREQLQSFDMKKTDRNGVARISHPKTSIVLSHNSIAAHCFCAQSLIFTVLYKHFYIPCQHKNNLL